MNKRILFSAVLAGVAVLATAAGAGNVKPRIAAPAEGTSGLGGCWTADRELYGPYQLSFCIEADGSGTYQVTGGKLDCSANLEWNENKASFRFDMDRATCGNGTDWTADSFTCLVSIDPVAPQIAAPAEDAETTNRLDCTYNPAVAGYKTERFDALRD
ncbi:MAG: hypothetical protein U1E49_07480 [Hyphomicrobiaceae bacterium]